MINVDAMKQAICNMFIGQFVGKLFLSYSITAKELYNVLHAVELGVDPYPGADEEYNRSYNVERSYRRIEHIASRLKTRRTGGTSMFEAKIYDEAMFRELICSYNRVAAMVDRPMVTAITENLLQRADVTLESARRWYDDTLVRTGYCVDIGMMERSAFTFPELLLYSSLYMSTYNKSVSTLNKELIQKKDYERALRWRERQMKALQSNKLYEAIICELFDMIYDIVSVCLTETSESSIQKYWLNEKYRNRKDRRRVIKKLDKITHDGEVSKKYLEENLEKHPEWNDMFFESFELCSVGAMLIEEIMPRAEMIALRRMHGVSVSDLDEADKFLKSQIKELQQPKANHSTDSKTKMELDFKIDEAYEMYEDKQFCAVATWLAESIVKVIEEGYGVVEKMLLCLHESVAWNND